MKKNWAFKLLEKKVKKKKEKKEIKKKRNKGEKNKLFSKKWFKSLSTSVLILLFVFLVIIATLFLYIFKDLPSPTKLSQGSFPTSTLIYDRNGVLLYEIYTDQNRTPIKLDDMPDYLKQATIAIEDKDFYKHRGLAFRGISRAFLKTVFKKELQGGSTITQQLVKTTLLTPERTIKRKIREAILASFTELLYKKDEILEMYLNHVPYGGTAYGIEEASRRYFNKKAQDLSLAEAALLAGLPAAPTRYSPFGAKPHLAKERQVQVLKRMVEDGYISKEEMDKAKEITLNYAPQTNNIKAPHFVMYVKDLLVEKYGEQLVEQGGLRVTTSLDWKIQEFSEATVASETAKLEKMKVNNGAVMVTNPSTGEILSMVGSKDYFSQDIDGNFNVATSLRQPGSSIKPINYATGLINGHTPATLFLDIPTCFTAPGQPKLYCPHNYDNKFHGPAEMRSALANSYNIPAVKMLALNGIESMMATAKLMGINTWDKDSSAYGLSLTLGGGEVKMTEMTVAFGVFANLGKKVDLHPILKVEDYKGNLYQEFKKEEIEKPEVISPAVAYLINDILSDNQARSPMFGSYSKLVIPDHQVAVKTGTTDHPSGPRDNWTIGYTPSFLVISWIGNNDNSPMNPYLVSGVTGAAPIWNKITQFVLKDQEPEFWNQPENIVKATTCTWERVENKESKEEDKTEETNSIQECHGREELFIKGTEKKQSIGWVEKKNIFIDKETQRPPIEDKTDNLEEKEHLVGHDPFSKDYCLTCPHEEEKPIVVSVDENLNIIIKEEEKNKDS
ncbi:penicillin-binding protein [Candidatus Beckwithbacteria bacterium CG10_big_fil_rev_8_21_14_0_10_34_10]|uniref:Penicillin-binding protein n=1 Tax=Candidatus Beckwithbacteria bacterium CG10_big_fil_rev_8_21_14_0_10_34_10 TaxID=1974495 RepID=A0A2H0W836_9BACT|nr:MAG: penicillin-binding protein [Candidatus Beckwithbacteria bacterium CG10_big_fil_rev_8_21_14_0_10_34_10]